MSASWPSRDDYPSNATFEGRHDRPWTHFRSSQISVCTSSLSILWGGRSNVTTSRARRFSVWFEFDGRKSHIERSNYCLQPRSSISLTGCILDAVSLMRCARKVLKSATPPASERPAALRLGKVVLVASHGAEESKKLEGRL